MTDPSLKTLEDKVDALIALCVAMKSENQRLREQEHAWHTERKQLLGKNELAKSRLEKVLERLKALQQE